MTRLRAAVVGAGFIAGKKYLPSFGRQRGRIELAAICDIHEQAARGLAQRFGVPRVYTDLQRMLMDVEPDLVVICTPPQTHAETAVAAITHGSNVLIEKPMATTVEECDEIIDAARPYGVKLCVAHTDLFYPPVRRARELVARGAIGDFTGMRIWFSTPATYMTTKPDHWAHRLPGGVIGETGPHGVYLTLAFISPIHEVVAYGLKCLPYPWSRFEDYRLELVGEHAMSTFTSIYTTNQWAAQVDIWGTAGILKLDLEFMSLVRYRREALDPWRIGLSGIGESAQLAKDALWNGVQVALGRYRTTHDVLLAGFAHSLLHDTDPPVTAQEGREAVRVMNLIAERLEGQATADRPLG